MRRGLVSLLFFCISTALAAYLGNVGDLESSLEEEKASVTSPFEQIQQQQQQQIATFNAAPREGPMDNEYSLAPVRSQQVVGAVPFTLYGAALAILENRRRFTRQLEEPLLPHTAPLVQNELQLDSLQVREHRSLNELRHSPPCCIEPSNVAVYCCRGLCLLMILSTLAGAIYAAILYAEILYSGIHGLALLPVMAFSIFLLYLLCDYLTPQ